jgi:hypothetical protein
MIGGSLIMHGKVAHSDSPSFPLLGNGTRATLNKERRAARRDHYYAQSLRQKGAILNLPGIVVAGGLQ